MLTFINQTFERACKQGFTLLMPFRVLRVSGAHLRGFAPGLTHQGCSGGESLVTCGKFGRLGT